MDEKTYIKERKDMPKKVRKPGQFKLPIFGKKAIFFTFFPLLLDDGAWRIWTVGEPENHPTPGGPSPYFLWLSQEFQISHPASSGSARAYISRCDNKDF